MKILFTTPVLEHPAAGGPQLRIENSIIALNKIAELHVISRVDKERMGGDAAEAFFKNNCNFFSYSPKAKPMSKNRLISKIQNKLYNFLYDDSEFIIDYVKNHDISLIWFGYGNISFELIKKIKAKMSEIKAICDTDSVWSKYVLRELPYETDPARKAEIEMEGRRKEMEEKEWVNLCEVTAAVSEVDAEYYRSIARDVSRIKIFSNVINLSTYRDKPKPPSNFKTPCIYLAGSFWPKSPMDKAARWVINEVFPLLKNKMPGLHFYIVGNNSNTTLADVKNPDITITGKLNSVLPYLFNANVVMVPLMFESGTRFKILEAGACGIPIVSTTLGAEGIPVVNEESILIADSAPDFANAIIRIIEDGNLRGKLTKNCMELIKKSYSIESLVKEAENILDYLKILN